jgi:hypothetical protein
MAAIAEAQAHLLAALLLQLRLQLRRIDGPRLPAGSGHADGEGRGLRVGGEDAWRHSERLLNIARQSSRSRVDEPGPIEDQIPLLTAGEPRETARARFTHEGEGAVSHQARKPDEGFLDLLARHALDGISADGLERANAFHDILHMQS